MKKLMVCAICVMAMLACQNTQQKKSDSKADEDAYVPQRSDYSIKTEVTVMEDEGDIYYDDIFVYLTDAHNQTDTLVCEALPLDTASWSRSSIGEVMEEDYNFDGIPDLQIGLGPMNGYGNFQYDVFIWDDTNHRFVHYDIPELYDPYVNTEDKQIISSCRIDSEIEYITYEWRDNEFVEVNRETENYDDLMGE